MSNLMRGEGSTLPFVLHLTDAAYRQRGVFLYVREEAYGLAVYAFKEPPGSLEPDIEQAMCSVHVGLFDNRVVVLSYDEEQTRNNYQSLHYDKLVGDVDGWQPPAKQESIDAQDVPYPEDNNPELRYIDANDWMKAEPQDRS